MPDLWHLMARFVLEMNDPLRRIIRLVHHCKHKINYPDELCKCPRQLYLFLPYCILSNYFENIAEYQYYRSTIVRVMQYLYTQTNHPSRRSTPANSSEQTNYAHSSS